MLFNAFEQFFNVSLFSTDFSIFSRDIFGFDFLNFSVDFNKIFYSEILVTMALLFILFIILDITNLKFFENTYQRIFKEYYLFLFQLIKGAVSPSAFIFFPFLFSVFTFIFLFNLLGMFPFGMTITSHIFVTFGLALTILFGYEIISFNVHGIKHLGNFLPEGVPPALSLFLPIIEFISYSFRVISLSIRLIANMISGHLLLHILLSFIYAFLFMSVFGVFFSVILKFLAVSLLLALILLELGICFLQAYVFIILLCLYLNSAIVGH